MACPQCGSCTQRCSSGKPKLNHFSRVGFILDKATLNIYYSIQLIGWKGMQTKLCVRDPSRFPREAVTLAGRGTQMSKIIGIDLGTTNSVVAVMEGCETTDSI